MITINMHEAKTRLSALVKAVEENGETIILCRNGTEVAEIRAINPKPIDRLSITPDPNLKVQFAADYDPAEPLSDDEWPEECR